MVETMSTDIFLVVKHGTVMAICPDQAVAQNVADPLYAQILKNSLVGSQARLLDIIFQGAI